MTNSHVMLASWRVLLSSAINSSKYICTWISCRLVVRPKPGTPAFSNVFWFSIKKKKQSDVYKKNSISVLAHKSNNDYFFSPVDQQQSGLVVGLGSCLRSSIPVFAERLPPPIPLEPLGGRELLSRLKRNQHEQN